MARTISGRYSSGITLTNPSDNPVTVTGTISLGAFGIDLQAASAWSIINSGSILGLVTGAPGNSYGVELTASGYVRNSASGLIRAGVGIDISGAAGSVHNKGSIVGQAALYSPDWGIGLHHGGYVYNGSSGRIKHAGDGIFITGGAGTVINEGSIGSAQSSAYSAQASADVYLGSGGSVSNSSSGRLTGALVGVDIKGGTGSVTNAGKIKDYGGIWMSSDGVITNASSGLISAHLYSSARYLENVDAISIAGAGTVLNFGTITSNEPGHLYAPASEGIYIGGSGFVTNAASATIRTSGELAIHIHGANGTVENAGSVYHGIQLDAGGMVNNAVAGTTSYIGIGGAAGTILN
jgi:hypothetical protein